MENGTLPPDEKLKLLQRLDRSFPWRSTSERRLCLGCGKLISGREIKFKRGMGGLGLIDLECPTEDCNAGFLDWVDPRAEAVPRRKKA
jgi:hypothetical protein